MFVTEYFKIPKGHQNIDFVDININGDTPLFIDPCLIEVGDDAFCENAFETMQDYFDCLYKLYREHKSTADKLKMFSHAHEINDTKMGYGSGNNGKAKTAEGMLEALSDLQKLVDAGIPISKAIDIPIFMKDFAEDCMSDMITNIIYDKLNKFTIEQCEKYGVEPQRVGKKNYFWDKETHDWCEYKCEGLIIDGKQILLIPKGIVRKRYYYDVEQYFQSVILEKMQKEQTVLTDDGKEDKPSKKQIKKELLRSYSDILDISTNETMSTPDLLDVHHNRLELAYKERGMSDEALDQLLYTI